MTTWTPLDLSEIGDVKVKTTLLHRIDGHALLYPFRIHWFHGESESHKTWLALCAVAEALTAGHRSVYVDFEDHPEAIVGRLIALGIDRETLNDIDRFAYIRPDESVTGDEPWQELYATLDRAPVSLVVLDGVTESMTCEDLDANSNRDIAEWVRRLPRPIADRTQAAVVCIDHVTKSREGRGSYAIGGQHKKAVVDGAAYSIEVIRPLAPVFAGTDPHQGIVAIRIAKDRGGHVRAVSDANSAGSLELTAWPDETVTWQITTAALAADYGLRARIADLLRGSPGASKRTIRDLAGDNNVLDGAVAGMIADGEVTVVIKGAAHLHHLTEHGHTTYPNDGP